MTPVHLVTKRLIVRTTTLEDAAPLARYFHVSRDHFLRWDPPRPDDFFTAKFWRERIPVQLHELERGESVRLVVVESKSPDVIIGSCNFTQIARGPFCSCQLGYGIAPTHEGRGFMAESLRASLAHIFDAHGMHRVAASYLPINERSGALLRRLGFAVDGYARDYLFINGAWRDHVLTSLINPNPMTPPLG